MSGAKAKHLANAVATSPLTDSGVGGLQAIIWGTPLIGRSMLQGWLRHLGPIDLVMATLDIALGLAAVAWLGFTMRRSTHHREPGGRSR